MYLTGQEDVLGPIFEEDRPIITDTSPENFFAAVEKRVNYFSAAHATSTYDASMHLLDEKVPERLDEVVWSQELFEEWNSHNAPSKQTKMVQAVEEFSRFTDKEFGKKDIFTKVEVLLKSHDPDWAGRLINNSSDMHNAISGPYLQACTKRLNSILDKDDADGKYRMAYGSKTTDKVCDTFSNLPGEIKHVIECDFSSNDMMQVKEAQLCEAEWLYRLGAPKWLTDVMTKANVYNVYNRTFQFSAVISYQLPSGSTSTTFRNCIWNMSIFHQFATRKIGKATKPNLNKYCVFVLGDDMIAVILESKFPVRERGRYLMSREYEYVCNRLAKMKAKVKVHRSLPDAEFLSKCFCPTSKGMRMFPKLRAFAKLNVRANLNPSLTNQDYMLGKLYSYAWEFRYLPLVRDALIGKATALEEAFNIDILTVSEAALTYNFWKLAKETSRVEALSTMLVDDEDEITEDDINQFLHYRYGWFATDLEELLYDLLYGDEDIPLAKYRPLAEADWW